MISGSHAHGMPRKDHSILLTVFIQGSTQLAQQYHLHPRRESGLAPKLRPWLTFSKIMHHALRRLTVCMLRLSIPAGHDLRQPLFCRLPLLRSVKHHVDNQFALPARRNQKNFSSLLQRLFYTLL